MPRVPWPALRGRVPWWRSACSCLVPGAGLRLPRRGLLGAQSEPSSEPRASQGRTWAARWPVSEQRWYRAWAPHGAWDHPVSHLSVLRESRELLFKADAASWGRTTVTQCPARAAPGSRRNFPRWQAMELAVREGGRARGCEVLEALPESGGRGRAWGLLRRGLYVGLRAGGDCPVQAHSSHGSGARGAGRPWSFPPVVFWASAHQTGGVLSPPLYFLLSRFLVVLFCFCVFTFLTMEMDLYLKQDPVCLCRCAERLARPPQSVSPLNFSLDPGHQAPLLQPPTWAGTQAPPASPLRLEEAGAGGAGRW